MIGSEHKRLTAVSLAAWWGGGYLVMVEITMDEVVNMHTALQYRKKREVLVAD